MSKLTLIRSADQDQSYRVSRPSLLPVAAVAFVTAITGTAIGFVAAFSIAMPMMRQALASEVSGANARLASLVTSDGEGCFETAPSGEVLGAETASMMPGQQAPSSENNQSAPSNNAVNNNEINKTFIKKLVGGQFVNNTAVIKDTGPNSSNEVITKNIAVTTVTNTNDVNVTSTNDQSAATGSANISGNTSGGSASTGSSDNSNDTSLALTINN